MIVIENAFSIGEFVYLRTDPSQEKKMVVGINILPGNMYMYRITSGQYESVHYEMEISREMDLNLVIA